MLFFLYICNADIPRGECSAPIAVLSRQETMKDRDACFDRVYEFVDFWVRPGRGGIPGQHFIVGCKELPGA